MDIEKKQIMESKSSNLTLFKYFLVFYGPVVAFFIFIGAGWSLLEILWYSIFIAGFIFVLLIFPINYVLNKRLQSKVLSEAKDAFAEFIGKPVKYSDTSFSIGKSGINGTAIAYDDNHVYIMDHGLAAKIHWDKIRSWEWSIPGQILMTATSMNNAAAVANANSKSRTMAYLDSGFFVHVADIDKPRWQFMTSDESLLIKWMEIFKQVKEGSLI